MSSLSNSYSNLYSELNASNFQTVGRGFGTAMLGLAACFTGIVLPLNQNELVAEEKLITHYNHSLSREAIETFSTSDFFNSSMPSSSASSSVPYEINKRSSVEEILQDIYVDFTRGSETLGSDIYKAIESEGGLWELL